MPTTGPGTGHPASRVTNSPASWKTRRTAQPRSMEHLEREPSGC